MSNRIHSFAIILHPRRGAGAGCPAYPRKGRRRTSLPAAKRKGREEKDHLFRSESAAPSAGEGAFARSRLRGLSHPVAPRVPTAPAAPLFIAPGKNAGQPLYLWVYRNRQIWTVRERNVNDRGQDGGVFAAGGAFDAVHPAGAGGSAASADLAAEASRAFRGLFAGFWRVRRLRERKGDRGAGKMEPAFSMPGGAPCPAGARRDAKISKGAPKGAPKGSLQTAPPTGFPRRSAPAPTKNRPSRSGRGASEKIAYSSTISATGAFSRTEAMPFSQLSLAA